MTHLRITVKANPRVWMAPALRKISSTIGPVRVPWRTVRTLVPHSQWSTVVLVSRIRCFQPIKWRNIWRLKKLKRRVSLPLRQQPRVLLKLCRRSQFLKNSANPLISIPFLTSTLMRNSNQCRCLKIRLTPFFLSQKARNQQLLNSKVKLPKSSHIPRRKTPRFRLRKANSILWLMLKKIEKHGPLKENLKMPRQ